MYIVLLLLLSRFSRVRLCYPIDGSPLGSSVCGILQARILEWVAISFSNPWKWKVKVKSLSRAWLLVTPWTAAHQAPPSVGVSRQEYWSGLPLPSPKLMLQRFIESISSVQFSCSVLSVCDPMDCSPPGLPVNHQFLEFTQIHVHWVGDAIQPSQPLSSPSPAFNLSQHQGLFQWVFASSSQSSVASASVLPMNIQDWFPLGWTGWISLQSKRLKSLPQHHSSKASILWCSAFFVVQLSHPYMTTGKTIALTRQTFVGKLMSLLFNMLSWL